MIRSSLAFGSRQAGGILTRFSYYHNCNGTRAGSPETCPDGIHEALGTIWTHKTRVSALEAIDFHLPFNFILCAGLTVFSGSQFHYLKNIRGCLSVMNSLRVPLKKWAVCVLGLTAFAGQNVSAAAVDPYAPRCGYGHKACQQGYDCIKTTTCKNIRPSSHVSITNTVPLSLTMM